jgi:hypothetical protein
MRCFVQCLRNAGIDRDGYAVFFGLPPLRFGGAGGSSVFFGRPPLRLTGAGGPEETIAGASMVAAVLLPLLWSMIWNRRMSTFVLVAFTIPLSARIHTPEDGGVS